MFIRIFQVEVVIPGIVTHRFYKNDSL